MKRKIIIAILLSVAMFISTFPVFASTSDSTQTKSDLKIEVPANVNLGVGRHYSITGDFDVCTKINDECYFCWNDPNTPIVWSVESSNPKVVAITNDNGDDDWEDDDDGFVGFFLYAKSKGTATIKIKCTYTDINTGQALSGNASFKVISGFSKKIKTLASLYDIRSSVFYISVQNFSEKTITIYSSGAKSTDRDYKKFDCKLKLNKGSSISIKPGKTKTVKFKVKSGKPWQDVRDETVYFTLKWNGKKYKAKVNQYMLYIKSGGKWKSTDVYW